MKKQEFPTSWRAVGHVRIHPEHTDLNNISPEVLAEDPAVWSPDLSKDEWKVLPDDLNVGEHRPRVRHWGLTTAPNLLAMDPMVRIMMESMDVGGPTLKYSLAGFCTPQEQFITKLVERKSRAIKEDPEILEAKNTCTYAGTVCTQKGSPVKKKTWSPFSVLWRFVLFDQEVGRRLRTRCCNAAALF